MILEWIAWPGCRATLAPKVSRRNNRLLPFISRTVTVLVCGLLLPSNAPAVESLAPTRPAVPAATEFRQRVYSRENGLPDNRILSLLQSRDGFLWIGTASGVARFDGLKFQVFGPDLHPEFVNDEVAALAEGLDGAIWIGTKDGLLRLQAGRIQRFTEQDGLANKRIHSLCATRNGDVWIGTSRGLDRLRQGRMENLPMPEGKKPENREVQSIYEDASGAVWCGSAAGVRRWDAQSDQLREIRLPGDDYAARIHGDSQTNVWFKGSWLIRWREGQFHQVTDELGSHALLATRNGTVWLNRASQFDGEIGLLRLEGNNLNYYERQDGLSDNFVTALLEDRQGNLWIGTDSGGLNCWQPRRFPTIGKVRLANERVWTLAPARDDGIWIGTEEGVSLWRGGRMTPQPIWLRMVDERIRALHEAADGLLWICTGNAVEVWDGFQSTPHRWLNQVSGDKYRTVTSDRNGVVRVGGESGLMRWQDGQWRQFTTADGLPHNDVYVTCSDSAGRFWIGTYGGGVSWLGSTRDPPVPSDDSPDEMGATVQTNRDGRFAGSRSAVPVGGSPTGAGESPAPPIDGALAPVNHTSLCPLTLNTNHGLSHNEVRALHADRDGFLWVGTERGLNLVDLRGLPAERRATARPVSAIESRRAGSETGAPLPRIHAFTRRDGLYDDLVSEILEDDLGNLWISCSRGIYRLSKSELNNLAALREHASTAPGAPTSLSAGSETPTAQRAGRDAGAPGDARLHCIVYDEGDGLLSTDVTGQKSRPAGCKTADGRLWFPNAKGVVVVDPQRVIEGDVPPPVVIEHVLVDGEDCAGRDFVPPSAASGAPARGAWRSIPTCARATTVSTCRPRRTLASGTRPATRSHSPSCRTSTKPVGSGHSPPQLAPCWWFPWCNGGCAKSAAWTNSPNSPPPPANANASPATCTTISAPASRGWCCSETRRPDGRRMPRRAALSNGSPARPTPWWANSTT